MLPAPGLPSTPLRAGARVLAVRTDNIGDVLMLSPALRGLRAAVPGAHVTLLCSPAGAQAAPLLAEVDDVLVERVVWQDASGGTAPDPSGDQALIDRLRAGGFDAALIFTSWSQTPWAAAYACHLAGIPIRAGESKEFGGSLLSHRAATVPDEVHQVDRNLHLLAALGIGDAGRDIRLRLPAPALERADRLLGDAGLGDGTPFVVLAPGASCAARRYDPDRFADAAAALTGRHGVRLLLVGSERERDLVAGIAARAGDGCVSLVGRTSVPDLAALVARAAVVVANNSGPMHLADAFARPQVICYSGSDRVTQWEPRFSPTRLLRREVACSPCYRFTCPFAMECLDVPASEVVRSVVDLLSRR